MIYWSRYLRGFVLESDTLKHPYKSFPPRKDAIRLRNQGLVISKNEILFELKEHLPNHMIPSIIVYKEKLPQTSPSEAKVDKEVLKKEVMELR